jgi:hypothetical protein
MTAMIQENEVRAKLAALEAGELPLWAFYDWIERASLNMHRDSSNSAMDLVGSIGLLFADFDMRVINEKDLRQKLIAIIRPVTVTYYFPGVSMVAVNPLRLVSGSQSSEWGRLLQAPQLI